MNQEYSINPNARFFTVLTRASRKKAFIFVWDFMHWLRFDSAGTCKDISNVGTGKSFDQAYKIIEDNFPAKTPVVIKYCPKSFTWQ